MPPSASSASSGSRGGNIRFRCHFCSKDFPGTYSRVRAHLQIKGAGIATCDKIPHPVFEQICKEDKVAKVAVEMGATRRTLPLPPYDDSGPSRKRKQSETTIGESFNADLRQ